MKAMLLILSIGAFFIFLSSPVFSQSFLVHHYTETEGLPSATVYDITQDQWGRIWFATRAGIAVYDGVSWGKYSMTDGLPVSSFHKIQSDGKGRIWAIARSASEEIIVVYRQIEPQEGMAKSQWNIMRMHLPPATVGKPTFLTSFQLLEPQDNTDLPVIAVGVANLGVFLWYRGKWIRFTTASGLPADSVYGMTVLRDKIYVATGNGLSALLFKDGPVVDNHFTETLSLPAREIYGITVQHKGKYPDPPLDSSRVWLYGEKWLGYFREGHPGMTVFPIKLPLGEGSSPEDIVVHLVPDYYCGLYFGNKMSLHYFNYITSSWEALRKKNGLITDGTHSLFVDWEKNLWIASDRGVSKIASRRFSNFQKSHGLLEDEVTAVLEIEPGKFALGHNYGITLYDESLSQFTAIPLTQEDRFGLPMARVMEMQLDSQKNIWLAMAGAGLVKINLQAPYRVTRFGKTHGLPENINCLWLDKMTGELFVGTNKAIYFQKTRDLEKDSKAYFNLFTAAGLIHSTPRRIFAEGGKLRYIATPNKGVYIYKEDHREGKSDDQGEWQNYQIPDNPNANNVFAIKKDRQGRLLIGTAAGLYTLENETLTKFKQKDFQVERPVYFILEDLGERLWIGTDYGVVRWDGKEERVYSSAEGLMGQETNRAAGVLDSRGRIWIGTNSGVSIYNEAFDQNDRFNPPPRLYLLSLETPYRRIPLQTNKPVRLEYKENTLVLHFRGISFADEAAVRFKYRLVGFEKTWSEEKCIQDQQIRYTNLPPGEYCFHLVAKNVLGVWSPVKTSPLVIISPPFFKAWWFVLLVILSIGAVFYGIFQLVTEKRYAADLERKVDERTAQLQAVEKQYRSLFEESKDMVFISSPEGKLLDINPAGVELFRIQSRQDVLGKDYIGFYANSTDRTLFQAEIEKNGYVKDYEMSFKLKDGEMITTLVTASLVRDNQGNVIAYRGILRDITEKKRLEQRLSDAQKMEAIGTLAGGIAHDFNNILAVIMGQAELIRDELPDGVTKISAPQVSWLHKSALSIITAATKGADLVKQILTFSRKTRPERKPIRFSQVIKDSLNLLRSILPATIVIRQEIRCESGFIMADPGQIHQVMVNFGTNAAHAMKEQGGTLMVDLDEVHLEEESVKLFHDLKPGTYIKLTVSDTGEGMNPEVVKRIFEPYFTTKGVGEGSGMGLAVAHGIVKSLGGDITVNSIPGKGTAFCVLLPKMKEHVEVTAKTPPAEKIPPGQERILLVDDEQELVESGIRLLKRIGYRVTGATNPDEALELFKQDPRQFDLVITDLIMPKMTGIQLAQEIKKLNPGIPIILLSGYSSDVTMKQDPSSLIDDFVTKPINKTDLVVVICKVLKDSAH